MLNNIIFEIFIYYLSQNNSFIILNNLKLLCNTYNNNIKNDIYYIRKKSAYLLNKILIKELDNSFYNIYDFLDQHYDFKYILNSIFNIYTEGDFTYNNYIKNLYKYKDDKIDPLKRLPLFKKNETKNRMKNSLRLNMALDHAEKNYSFNIAREIDEYY